MKRNTNDIRKKNETHNKHLKFMLLLLEKILLFRQLYKKLKVNSYKTIVFPVVVYDRIGLKLVVWERGAVVSSCK